MELLDGTTAESSVWVDCRLLTELTFQVNGIVTGDEVTIEGTNQNPAGVASPTVTAMGAAITADGFTSKTELPGWVRATRSAVAGAGNVVVSVSTREH